ncbi:MAG: D-alanine--D-alanine ligase A [Syntrophus sp. SKADARSKE-3]|nr:D-alanine--D-alanine ligase A [Syntrophus sp. SKADARSKE-3]
MKKLRVGIIMGGMSSEREVSLNSGRNVYDNLDPEYYEGIPVFMDADGALWIIPWQLVSQNTTVDIAEHLEEQAHRIAYESLKTEIEFAFICLHGKYGDDGCIQGLLELLKIPYTGPGVQASALGMDKNMQQKVLRASGLGTPESIVVFQKEWNEDGERVKEQLLTRFSLPFFVKPSREGSSMGVSMIREASDIENGLNEAFRWDNAVLAEEALSGIEFSCIILEDEDGFRALDLTEIRPQSAFYTYDDKYMPGRCRKFTPPKNIAPDAVEKIKAEAVRAFRTLGFRSYGRIDGFYQPDGRILITDPNSSSGMAPSSFFFEQAASAGMLPSMIIGTLIENALRIHREKLGPL